MYDDPAVTFGASGIDRAAHLRGDAGAVGGLWADGRSGCLALWRGKPMVAGDQLAILPAGHPLFADGGPRLFLGLADGRALFAADLSAWTPDRAADQAAEQGAFLDTSVQHHPLTGPDIGFQDLRAVMARLSARDAELAATARALFAWHDSHGFCARCGAQSLVAMAGWQRECPACGAPHFPRTDPVVIMLITRGNRVLLGRSPGWPEGMFSLLAGFMEPGETIEAAVRREVAEEAGVPVGRVRYLASQPWPFPASLMIGCWGEALDEVITHDPAEIEQALWLSREDMAAVFAGDHPVMKAPRAGAIAAHLLSEWLVDRVRTGA